MTQPSDERPLVAEDLAFADDDFAERLQIAPLESVHSRVVRIHVLTAQFAQSGNLLVPSHAAPQ